MANAACAESLYGRFKTPEEMFAWLREREKQGGHKLWYRSGKAQARKKVKPAARNGKPANRKPVHKGA